MRMAEKDALRIKRQIVQNSESSVWGVGAPIGMVSARPLPLRGWNGGMGFRMWGEGKIFG